MLLPPSMQDKTQFLPLGKPMQKPEPAKADPVRDFERHNHDIPGAHKLPHVTPEMAARALRSLCTDEVEFPQFFMFGESSVEYEGPAHLSPFDVEAYKAERRSLMRGKLERTFEPRALLWPTLPDLPEPTFLPEVVNPAPDSAELFRWYLEF